jgi:hypothetical protein
MNNFASPDLGRAEAPNATVGSTTFVQRLIPSAALFLVAPLVAEFLLGNMSITHLNSAPADSENNLGGSSETICITSTLMFTRSQ